MSEAQGFEKIRLNISDELRALLQERRILDSDMQLVIDFAEKSQTKFLNRQTGHFLAHLQHAAVTYWVEYAVGENEFIIHDAYSHRMIIM